MRRVQIVAITIDILVLALLTLGVARALMASGGEGDIVRWRRQVSAQLSEHEARLRELDRYRDTVDAQRIGERLSRIEATQEATYNLLFAIAAAVAVMVTKDVILFLRTANGGRAAR